MPVISMAREGSRTLRGSQQRAALVTVVAALGFTLLGAATCESQETWNWRGRVAPGRAIEVKGVNGAITGELGSGDEVRVTASKSGRRSDPSEVEIVVLEHGGGVTICAVYPSRSGEQPNECRPGSGGRNNTHNNDVQVDFTIAVPRGVAFVGSSVNGNVKAASLQSDVNLTTVNGGIEASTSGLARGTTVNGSINAALGSNWTGDVKFETVNGGITLAISGDVNTDLTASTVNGSISSDFPLVVQGRFGPKRISGTIGNGGGRSLSLSTVNGSIRLRRVD